MLRASSPFPSSDRAGTIPDRVILISESLEQKLTLDEAVDLLVGTKEHHGTDGVAPQDLAAPRHSQLWLRCFGTLTLPGRVRLESCLRAWTPG